MPWPCCNRWTSSIETGSIKPDTPMAAWLRRYLQAPEGARELSTRVALRATVANYGSCKIASPYAGGKANVTFMDMLSADSDRPILMLMGELDIETPPATCFPLLNEMKAAGKPVEWHIYPKTTHGWDKANTTAMSSAPMRAKPWPIVTTPK